jgi:hypothetical protein
MRHILLTWNPGPDNDEQWSPEQWDSDMVLGTAAGQSYDGRWSVGNRVQGIEPGDRAYLLRQGTHGRGVVAIGEITSEPFTAESWREDGGTAQYVDVTWLEAVPLDERIDIQDLKSAIPEFGWDTVYSSGREITGQGAVLEELWAGQASEAASLPPVVQGAGFGTAEQNRKVEKAAIQHVRATYEAAGYAITSVEAARCGWDLTAVKGNEELHVEVKGVAGSLVQFFLTANEHKTALADSDWLLVVVTDALGDPGWCQLDGPAAASYAEPALFQVRIPADAFTGL